MSDFPEDHADAKQFKKPISGFSSTNQEQDRIAREIEAVFNELPEEVHGLFVNAKAIMHSVCTDLGYEDEDELEDALGMSFLEFVELMECVEIGEVMRTDGSTVPGLKMIRGTPSSQWKRVVLTITISTTNDLWQVLYLSPQAQWRIPEIDFTVVADGNKKVHNPVFNHLATALQNLELFQIGMSEEMKGTIKDQMVDIQRCMDLEICPFTIVVDDPSGLSSFESPELASRVEYEREEQLEEEKQEIDEDLLDKPTLIQ